jgi:GNAT superfamily N-acetyltransferase
MSLGSLDLYHIERLSNDPKVLAYVRRINSLFLKQGKTDIDFMHSEYEAVFLVDPANAAIAAIVVFERQDFAKRKLVYYWIPIVWTATKYRGKGCYPRLLEWLKDYARSKGATSLSTEVKHGNGRMLDISDKHWEREYVRFKLKL